MKKTKHQAVFGDFQTPLDLARRVAQLVEKRTPRVRTVVEPTCGTGNFLRAATEVFGDRPDYRGFDLDPAHVEASRAVLDACPGLSGRVERKDFYTADWKTFLADRPAPVLVIGNPPWATSAALGALGGGNLPKKSNFQKHAGFDAKTGKANFDISEWMLIRLLEAMQGTRAALAMLCKTATARKVLGHAWRNGLEAGPSTLHRLDAKAAFGVSADACLLYTHTGSKPVEPAATVYRDLSFDAPRGTFGLLDGRLVSDVDAYRALRDLDGPKRRRWRSGVKHDASRIMEFTEEDGVFVNGLGERYALEETHLFPLLKSSDLANGRLRSARRVLVTQRRIGDDTGGIRRSAPRTWRYLLDHAGPLDRRRSSVYAKGPRFSVFGVGDYTFTPARVAVSGLYKTPAFRAVGRSRGKPVLVDDTCYVLPCRTFAEASFFADLLNAETAMRFLSALVFLDAKRPVTIDVLERIDLLALAARAGRGAQAKAYLEGSHRGDRRETPGASSAFDPLRSRR